MKKISVFVLAVLVLAMSLCGCGNDSASVTNAGKTTARTDKGSVASTKNDKSDTPVGLPKTFEIAATDPHYIISTPDWHAEGYGCGFALNEKGSKDYAIVVACGYEASDASLNDAFTTLYNDAFSGILMQNYRAKYAQFGLDLKEVKLANGSTALHFDGIQSADDYGTELNCPIYGYGFTYNGVPFIVACIVMKESAVDDAKLAEMKGYVDDMASTVRAAE